MASRPFEPGVLCSHGWYRDTHRVLGSTNRIWFSLSPKKETLARTGSEAFFLVWREVVGWCSPLIAGE